METPYTGRAIINDNYDGVEIIILAKKNWFAIVFICAWLFCLLYFITFVFMLLRGPGAANARLGVSIIFSFSIIPAVAAINRLRWNIVGKELIDVSPGIITIDRKGAFFKRAKSYDLSQCTHFRAVEVEMPVFYFFMRTADILHKKPNPGTISFDFDGEYAVQFGDLLPEAEGNYILDRLRTKKLIG